MSYSVQCTDYSDLLSPGLTGVPPPVNHMSTGVGWAGGADFTHQNNTGIPGFSKIFRPAIHMVLQSFIQKSLYDFQMRYSLFFLQHIFLFHIRKEGSNSLICVLICKTVYPNLKDNQGKLIIFVYRVLLNERIGGRAT